MSIKQEFEITSRPVDRNPSTRWSYFVDAVLQSQRETIQEIVGTLGDEFYGEISPPERNDETTQTCDLLIGQENSGGVFFGLVVVSQNPQNESDRLQALVSFTEFGAKGGRRIVHKQVNEEESCTGKPCEGDLNIIKQAVKERFIEEIPAYKKALESVEAFHCL